MQQVSNCDWQMHTPRHEVKKYSFRLLGGQITGIECAGVQLLYLSPLNQDLEKSLRGGLPLIFPQFAIRGPLKKHGWARDVYWSLLYEYSRDGADYLIMGLNIEPSDVVNWPHSARLTLSVVIFERAVKVVLTVLNTGRDIISWAGGLHPYWATKDLLQTELYGLTASPVEDCYRPEREFELHKSVCFSGAEYECLYDIGDSLMLKTPDYDLRLSMTGFDQWMVWNPGIASSTMIPDLPDNDWRSFLCIEPLLVDRPCTLMPGQSFQGSLLAELL